MSKIYGEEITCYLHDPPFIQAKLIDECQLLKISEHISWVSESLDVLVQHVKQTFSLEKICEIINTIPSYWRPYIKARSYQKITSCLISHIKLCISYLMTLPPYQLCAIVIAITPDFNNFICRPVHLIKNIRHAEYGIEVIYALNSSVQLQKDKLKEQYKDVLKERR